MINSVAHFPMSTMNVNDSNCPTNSVNKAKIAKTSGNIQAKNSSRTVKRGIVNKSNSKWKSFKKKMKTKQEENFENWKINGVETETC